MHFPWWYIPHLTGPMLIAVVSVLHVLVSHYAVGGGFFLAIETGYAYRKQDHEYLSYLKGHARFFVLLTVVFGAISGVGIWWTIGLASPLATELLIRTFVFGWAIEYVFFLIELVAAFAFLYYWGRLPPKKHVTVGWIYALAAWGSLVLITAITGFMLNPGNAPSDAANFWTALLNPQAIPQVISRTGGSLLLASLYIYLHSSLRVKNKRLHDMIQTRSTVPALLGAVLIALGGVGWYVMLPESAKAVLASAAVLNVFIGLLFVLTFAVFALLYIGPYRNPGWLSPGFAATLLLLGVGAFSIGEFVRESVRKPYVVYNLVLGNQIFPDEVEPLQRGGYLEGGVWTKQYMRSQFPRTVVNGQVDRAELLRLSQNDRIKVGAVLFQYHCNDCHAVTEGYSAVAPLLRAHTRSTIRSLVENLQVGHFFMPPWAGTPEEAEVLTEFLVSIAPPKPQGMAPHWPGKESK